MQAHFLQPCTSNPVPLYLCTSLHHPQEKLDENVYVAGVKMLADFFQQLMVLLAAKNGWYPFMNTFSQRIAWWGRGQGAWCGA